MAETDEGMEGLDLSIWGLETYFYADDGIVISTQPERLQRSFDALTGFFDRVGLKKNMRTKVSMACQPCHAPGRILWEACERRMTETWPTFWERRRRGVK